MNLLSVPLGPIYSVKYVHTTFPYGFILLRVCIIVKIHVREIGNICIYVLMHIAWLIFSLQ